MSDDATVDITEVRRGTVRVAARELLVGDVVFDAYGGEHALTRVRTLKNGTVKTARDDGWADRFAPDETLTIRR